MLEMPLFPACFPVPTMSTGETLWGALSRAARVAQWPTQMCHLGPAPKALANLETPSPPTPHIHHLTNLPVHPLYRPGNRLGGATSLAVVTTVHPGSL